MMRRAITAAVMLALAACGGGTDQQAEAISGGAETTTTTMVTTTSAEIAETTTTTEPQVSTEELTTGLPVTGEYGPLEVSVVSATLGKVVPRTFIDEPEADESTWVFLELLVKNTTPSQDMSLRELAWGITVDGDAQQPPEHVDGMRTVSVAANAAEETTVAFEVPPDTSFDQLALTVTEPDRIPTIIPLTAEPAPSEYPVDIGVAASGQSLNGGNGCRHLFDVDVRGASVSIDSPIIDTHVTTAYDSYRAALGERFLAIDVVMVNTGGGGLCGGSVSNLGNDDFRIVVDGVPQEPVNWYSDIIDVDTAFEDAILFAVPVDAAELEFQVGTADATLFTVPIPFAGLPAAPGE